MDYTSTLLISEFLISEQVMRGKRFLPIHIYSLASSSPSLVDPTRAHILQELSMQAWHKKVEIVIEKEAKANLRQEPYTKSLRNK